MHISLPQNCNLTGCDLQHANLRGSNLAGAILEDIRAPLHMSQTVNVTTTVGGQQGAGPPSQNGLGPIVQHQILNAAGAPPIVAPGDDNNDNVPLPVRPQQAANRVVGGGASEDGMVNGRYRHDNLSPADSPSSPQPVDQR